MMIMAVDVSDGPRPNYDEIVQLRSFMLLYIKQLLLKGQGVQEDELQSMLNYLCTLHEVMCGLQFLLIFYHPSYGMYYMPY